jgi:hypothetical protein
MTAENQDINPEIPRKSNRFQKNPAVAILLITIILLLIIEGISQVALWLKNTIQAQAATSPAELYIENLLAEDQIESDVFSAEMKELYIDGVEFHPYRWYRLPAFHSGTYFKTDAFGFRNEPLLPNQSKKLIAFYGGSTMFSIRTSQEKSIPGIINSLLVPEDSLFALNMGIGAYSSSNELNAFIETSRNYPIHTAVFFDGVNEVTRYLEKFMYRPQDSLYHSIGFPYFSTLEIAFGNTLKNQATEYQITKKWTWKPATYWVLISIIGKIKNLLPANPVAAASPSEWSESDYATAGKIAANLYLNNIRDISAIAKSRGIRAIFILQPTLFSSTRRGDEIETSYTRDQHPFVEAIHRYTYAEIQKADKYGIEFYDLSDGFDDLPPGKYFYDWHHCNAKGNEHLARKIIEKISIKNF